jgi:hypothetical protein
MLRYGWRVMLQRRCEIGSIGLHDRESMEARTMNKRPLIIAGAVVGGALVARRCAPSCEGFSFEKMVERMPDDAPPKWMFRNISAIRESTDQILRQLENGPPPGVSESSQAAA